MTTTEHVMVWVVLKQYSHFTVNFTLALNLISESITFVQTVTFEKKKTE